jgi:neutral trehalase
MHKYKEKWLRTFNKRDAYYKKANRRIFQINSHYMNEADKIIFKDFKIKSLSKDRALFFRSFISYKGSQAKRNRKLVFS